MEFFQVIFKNSFLLIHGAMLTIQTMLCATAISLSIGIIFGIISCNMLKIPFLSKVIEYFTFALRSIPFYVQLLIVYFVFPDLFGFNFEPFLASIISLGMCSAGYVPQIVRAGINSIPVNQWENAYTLGYSIFQTLKNIILPQMFRNVLPAFNNEFDSLLKSTAITSSIGMLELTRMGMNIVSRQMQPVPIYLSIAGIYVLFSIFMNIIFKAIESKISYVKN